MQSVVNSIISPGEIAFLLLLLMGFAAMIGLAVRAASKACTAENGKKLAVGTAKVAGKTVGKAVGRATWAIVKSRMGM